MAYRNASSYHLIWAWSISALDVLSESALPSWPRAIRALAQVLVCCLGGQVL
jgi:hypothetical protein